MLAEEMRQKASAITDRVYEQVIKKIDDAALDGRTNTAIECKDFSYKTDWKEVERKLKAEGFYVKYDTVVYTSSNYRTKGDTVLLIYWD